jgi:hypothetical protein
LQIRYFTEQNFESSDCQPVRIEAETIFLFVPKPISLTYFLAGPPGMVHTFRIDLLQRGLAPG